MKSNVKKTIAAALLTSALFLSVVSPAFASGEVESNNTQATANLSIPSNSSWGVITPGDVDYWDMQPFYYGSTSSTNVYFANQSSDSLQVRIYMVSSSTEYTLYSSTFSSYESKTIPFDFTSLSLPFPSYNPSTDKIYVRVSSLGSSLYSNYSFLY